MRLVESPTCGNSGASTASPTTSISVPLAHGLGFVVPHVVPPAFNLFVVIGGTRYEIGSLQALTVAELAAQLPDAMISALRAN